jgi:hypothetical protein
VNADSWVGCNFFRLKDTKCNRIPSIGCLREGVVIRVQAQNEFESGSTPRVLPGSRGTGHGTRRGAEPRVSFRDIASLGSIAASGSRFTSQLFLYRIVSRPPYDSLLLRGRNLWRNRHGRDTPPTMGEPCTGRVLTKNVLCI